MHATVANSTMAQCSALLPISLACADTFCWLCVAFLSGLTSGILVLVEPGTPAGAANIQEARAAILQHEARRAAKVQHKLAELPGATDSSGATAASNLDGSSGSGRRDFNMRQKLSSRWYGAHVVAPCPHDGPCPLAVPGSQAWCHFGTRFQRPAFMQASKALKGTHMHPADHQDERYSYVVIRRGARPAAAPQVEISRAFMPRAQAHTTNTWEDSGDVGITLSADATTLQQRHSLLASNQLQEPAVTAGDVDQPISATDVAPQRAEWQSTGSDIASNAQTSHAPIKQRSLVQADELQQLYALAGLARPHQQQLEQPLATQQVPAVRPAAVGADIDSPAHANHFSRVNAKLDVYGQGFMNRLMALEDGGVDWAGGSDSTLPRQLVREAANAGANDAVGSPSGELVSCSIESNSPKDAQHDLDLEREEALDNISCIREQQALDGVDVAAGASSSWSRY
eukprot:GHUV01024808.1.p1 GENE.GHUV01024808.1~~GHUV01024808.1.p1  ORF type:complete len:457 (+),score=150.86 GHUV01024808.1:372-1742(+)